MSKSRDSVEIKIIESSEGPYFAWQEGARTLRVEIEFKKRQDLNTKNDLLAKAIGLKDHLKKAKRLLKVIDATAGLCRDSFHLASLGCHLVALEENLTIFTVVNYHVEHLPEELKFELLHTPAQAYLSLLPEEDLPDVIYLDPMFPEKKKSAKSGKETELLKHLILPPTTAEENALLMAALSHARKRVVVKRPLHAPPLHVLPGSSPKSAGVRRKSKPDLQIKGKSVRYDVYLIAAKK